MEIIGDVVRKLLIIVALCCFYHAFNEISVFNTIVCFGFAMFSATKKRHQIIFVDENSFSTFLDLSFAHTYSCVGLNVM